MPEQLARFLPGDDALVISTGKTGFIHSRVFGTMSLRIAAVARCAVVVVRTSICASAQGSSPE